MKAIHLKTEYLENPIGIDIRHPRLFWNCEGGITQTAYRIVAKTDEQIVWDSGKIASESMHTKHATMRVYEGQPHVFTGKYKVIAARAVYEFIQDEKV